jgi:hypothetical protein
MHAQLGQVPPAEDGQGGELFIPRPLRTGLTAEPDDPSQTAAPNCRACSVEMAIRASTSQPRPMFDECTWRFMPAAVE